MKTTVATWAMIAVIVLAATGGDVLMTAAMRRIGDLDDVRARSGLSGAIIAVATSPWLMGGICCMAVSFFSLLIALSWAQLSLIGPATASLTFVTNAIAARFFLHENVDRRRWAAALCVCAGVALLAR